MSDDEIDDSQSSGEQSEKSLRPSLERMYRIATGRAEWTEEERAWLERHPKWLEYEAQLRALVQKRIAQGEPTILPFTKRVRGSAGDEPPDKGR